MFSREVVGGLLERSDSGTSRSMSSYVLVTRCRGAVLCEIARPCPQRGRGKRYESTRTCMRFSRRVPLLNEAHHSGRKAGSQAITSWRIHLLSISSVRIEQDKDQISEHQSHSSSLSYHHVSIQRRLAGQENGLVVREGLRL